MRLFGVRHHGPGSARALRHALMEMRPDVVLIEGPPEANDQLHWLAHADTEPPVALLLYRPDEPKRAGYYPYAVFSPEYQAIKFGFSHGIPVRFIDLPQRHLLAVDGTIAPPPADPFTHLARASGYRDYEAWWNMMVEQRRDTADLFHGIQELMSAMRHEANDLEPTLPTDNLGQLLTERREAHMRREIRRAQDDGFNQIAVVVGAWHVPALIDPAAYLDMDKLLLADLEMVPIDMAWVPWTYGRLAAQAGYGAGIRSPGWYDHLWEMGELEGTITDASVHWLMKVSELLREEDLDTSAAHIIETVRLAESLAALRDRPFPGLPELTEAIQTVMCGGHDTPLRLIQKRLVVGERMGMVPPETPMVPLQRDLYQQQRLLRLRPDPEQSTLKLDLRLDNHLARSHLLHRLRLLEIHWGSPMRARGSEGTYNEIWRLQWNPGLALKVVEANIWGNTVFDAALGLASETIQDAADLSVLTKLLDQVILAELPDLLPQIMDRIEDEAALSHDLVHMMKAVLPLARVMRYGNVRQTDQTLVRQVVTRLITRICIGLPSTCQSMNDQAAEEMFDLINEVHSVVVAMPEVNLVDQWYEMLGQLVALAGIHGLLAGRACRLLLNAAVITSDEAGNRLQRVLNYQQLDRLTVTELQQIAAWIEGFLRGSDLLLIYDDRLWRLVDGWVGQLQGEQFQGILPLLRRIFAAFSQAARRQLNERVRSGQRSNDPLPMVPCRF